MTIGLIGKKCGMTRVYTDDGRAVPVTVIEILANRVTQIKTSESDGYTAIQVTVGERKRTHLSKAEAGHFVKAGVQPGLKLHEFKVNPDELDKLQLASEIALTRFNVGQYVDVSGVTKGKGFAGAIKRHHFSSQDASHGNSLSHRAPGSIGQRQSPGKVFKGKKMAGHLGNKMRTILSQQIVHIDETKNLLLVKGAIPGAPSSFVIIRPAIKKPLRGEVNAS